MKCLIEQQNNYIVLSAYIKSLKFDSSCFATLKRGFVSSLGLLVKYNIPSLGCPTRIWDSFLTRVKNYGYVDNLACDSPSGIWCRPVFYCIRVFVSCCLVLLYFSLLFFSVIICICLSVCCMSWLLMA